MQTKLKLLTLAMLALAADHSLLSTALAQGAAFTYQGQITTNGAAYSGSAEFQFTLWDSANGGNSVATNNPASVIATVANGLFLVTLDFGLDPFNGQPRFLQTDVRTTIGPFITLAPRQPVTPTPYALRALNITTNALAGTYGNAVTFDNASNNFAGAFTGTVAGNGSGLTSVNAATLGGLTSANFWKTKGNAGANPTNGAFLGTTDNQPLELRVNNLRALRLEGTVNDSSHSNIVNVIAGSSANSLASGTYGATIAGGGAANYFGYPSSPNSVAADFGTVGGGLGNAVRASTFSTIAGGDLNSISNSFSSAIVGGEGNRIIGGLLGGLSTIGGGIDNAIGFTNVGGATSVLDGGHVIAGGDGNSIGLGMSYGVIGGGFGNTVLASLATIGGGDDNIVQASYATVGGGFQNTNSGQYAVIPGGSQNFAGGIYSFAIGQRAKALNPGTFVWADSTLADFASTSSNQFLIRAGGGVGIGTTSPSRELEVQHNSDVEIGMKSTDPGGHLWTLQSSAVTGSANLDASFQIIDRTVNSSRFFIGTNGFVGIGTSSPTNKLHVAGGVSATVFVTTSDRNAKEDFEPVSPVEVLNKVAALPITRWTFKEMPGQPHLGPMAQDFHAAFGLGAGDTGIATVDESGVALAAIQGLNQKLEEEKSENAALKARLEKLEKLFNQTTK